MSSQFYPPTSSSGSQKRLLNELKTLHSAPLPSFLSSLGPVSDAQILEWEAIMLGPVGGAYHGGRWKLDISIPDTYPLYPPTIKFKTRVCHPNIHFKSGEICLDLLKTAWSPAFGIATTLAEIHRLLSYPVVDSPLNVDVAALLREGDNVGAEGLVRWCCQEWRWDGEVA